MITKRSPSFEWVSGAACVGAVLLVLWMGSGELSARINSKVTRNSQIASDSCPGYAHLTTVTTWIRAPDSNPQCVHTVQAVAKGACIVEVHLTLNGQTRTESARMTATNELIEITGAKRTGQFYPNHNPPKIVLSDGCSYVEQQAAPPMTGKGKILDNGGWTWKCEEKLRKIQKATHLSKRKINANAPRFWPGKEGTSFVKLSGAKAGKTWSRLSKNLQFDARTWNKDDRSKSWIICQDKTVLQIDMNACSITDVYMPTPQGGFNDHIRDQILRDSKAMCAKRLITKLRFVRKSEVGIVADTERPLLHDLWDEMPIAEDGVCSYVDRDDGKTKRVPLTEDILSRFSKGTDFNGYHVQSTLWNEGKEKLAFLYGNNILVVADANSCEISEVHFPKPDGSANF